MLDDTTRRRFLHAMGVGAAAMGLATSAARGEEKPIQGFEKATTDPNQSKDWKPISDRKIRVGLPSHAGKCATSMGSARWSSSAYYMYDDSVTLADAEPHDLRTGV